MFKKKNQRIAAPHPKGETILLLLYSLCSYKAACTLVAGLHRRRRAAVSVPRLVDSLLTRSPAGDSSTSLPALGEGNHSRLRRTELRSWERTAQGVKQRPLARSVGHIQQTRWKLAATIRTPIPPPSCFDQFNPEVSIRNEKERLTSSNKKSKRMP